MLKQLEQLIPDSTNPKMSTLQSRKCSLLPLHFLVQKSPLSNPVTQTLKKLAIPLDFYHLRGTKAVELLD